MAKVFISYKRDPSFSLAKLISEKLKQADIDVFLDVERMDSAGPFPKRLLREIENSDIFICLLANSTLDAPWVQREIEHAHIMRRPMIPVFQESYIAPTEPLSHAVAEFLEHQGVFVLDKRGLYVDDAIDKLGRMVKETAQAQAAPPMIDTDDIDTEPIDSAPKADDDPTQIGDRTFNLRPQPKSRRWLWLVVAGLIIVLGIFLFQWVNGPIISAGVAGTQTAIALADGVIETPTPIDTLIPAQTPSEAPPATPTCPPIPEPAMFIVTVGGRFIFSDPTDPSTDIGTVSVDQYLPITGVSANSLYYHVDFNGQVGWISRVFGTVEGDLSSIPVLSVLLITLDGATVFSDPLDYSTAIGTVSEDQRLPITGVSANRLYYRVDFNGQVGWVSRAFGTVEGDVSSLTVPGDC